jgi:hypothetical protein
VAEVAVVMARLDAIVIELDKWSKAYDTGLKAFGPVDEAVEKAIEDYVAGLWDAHEKDGAKWPGEEARAMLARRALPPELRGEHAKIARNLKRCEVRIRALGIEARALMTVLAALRTEMEATS